LLPVQSLTDESEKTNLCSPLVDSGGSCNHRAYSITDIPSLNIPVGFNQSPFSSFPAIIDSLKASWYYSETLETHIDSKINSFQTTRMNRFISRAIIIIFGLLRRVDICLAYLSLVPGREGRGWAWVTSTLRGSCAGWTARLRRRARRARLLGPRSPAATCACPSISALRPVLTRATPSGPTSASTTPKVCSHTHTHTHTHTKGREMKNESQIPCKCN